MSDQRFRQFLKQAYKNSKLLGFRVGLPLVIGVAALVVGLLQSGLTMLLVGTLMVYIAWLKYENCRTSRKVFQAMEFLANSYEHRV